MERPPKKYVCEKCGYLGDTPEHEGCNYLAWTTGEQLYIDQLERELALLKASPARASQSNISRFIGNERGDKICHEDDGCPTELAVLKRFWREQQARPAIAPEDWKSLTDVQWMNIVNLNHAWYNVDKEEAINEVVKLVEAKCKANNLATPVLNRIKGNK